MRIAYVGPLPPHRGGIAQHGGQVVAAFERLGHEVTVESWGSLYPRLLFKGEQPVDFDGHRSDRVRFSLRWWNPLSWVGAGRRCRRADLVVVPWVTPVHGLALALIIAVARVPSVALVHNPDPHERMPLAGPLLALVLRRCRGAVVHAEPAAVKLRPKMGAKSIKVIPHPPNLTIEAQPLPQSPPLRLLLLGFVRPYKGVDLAIDAIGILRDRGRDVVLTVAGEFWENPQVFRQHLESSKVSESVDFVPGYVPDEDVGPLLASHHVLIAPYRNATASGVTPLAFAAGRPVVVTPVGGLPGSVEPGLNGAVASAVRAEAIADAVEAVAADLAEMSAGAAGSSSSWDDVASALLSVAD